MRPTQKKAASALQSLCFVKVIYIHIPFCKSFCTYCDFYSEIPSCGALERFVEALCTEISDRACEIPWGHNTLYIGGGTPSVLSLVMLRRIVDAISGHPFSEFTVEVNPDDIVRGGEGYVKGLRELGVNRVSMGVQSFDDRVLRWMNRRHNAAGALKAYEILKAGGISNISVDLIFGYGDVGGSAEGPFDPMASFVDSLKKAVELHPSHISAYQLSIEEGSDLAQKLARGEYSELSDELCAEQYALHSAELRAAGYHHYEISNFALPGYEAQHNSAYWNHTPYIGFGPGAHSFKNNIRSWNNPDLGAYMRAAQSGDWASVSGFETLTQEQLRQEDIMLGLRTDSGVPQSLLNPQKAAQLLSDGVLEFVASAGKPCGPCHPVSPSPCHLRICEDHLFVSDSIISELM